MLKLEKRFTIIITTLVLFYAKIGHAKDIKKQTYTILEGENLVVICNISESNDVNIYWTKNDTRSTFHQAGKRLEILDIKRSSSGDYICHALNTSYPVPDYNKTDVNKTVEVIYVDVQYPGEIDYFDIGPYTLMENQTFNVTCDFQGNPAPTWLIGNRDNGHTLITANLPAEATVGPVVVSCDDSGFWECTGQNRLNHGVNATQGHYITVNCPPRPLVGQNTYTVEAVIGKSASLIMNLVANPKVNYTWFKDHGSYDSKSTTQYDYFNKTILTFNVVAVETFGNYSLKMQNQFGTYYAQYQLTANGPPETPINLNFSDVTNNSVMLTWTTGFDMGSRQHCIIMKLNNDNSYVPRHPDGVFTITGTSYFNLWLFFAEPSTITSIRTILKDVSGWIFEYSPNHGIDQNWIYFLTGLASDTFYNLTVLSENERNFRSGLARPSVTFRTLAHPVDILPSSTVSLKIIIGVVCGIIGFMTILAFVVLITRYRSVRTSYANLDAKSRKM